MLNIKIFHLFSIYEKYDYDDDCGGNTVFKKKLLFIFLC